MNTIQSTELFNFLQSHKVPKDDKTVEVTHTSMGAPPGRYHIPVEEKDQFINLLSNALNNNIQVHLTEAPTKHSIIKIDFDFRFNLEENKRKYSIDNIVEIVKLYNTAIQYYMEIKDNQLQAFIFERDTPYPDKGNYKDGIHIMYPYIVCDTDIQHLIREHVLQHCQSIVSQIGCKNDIDDVIDESVISRNNWLMYGCCKMGPKPYKLTHIYDNNFNDINIRNYDTLKLLHLLSIRDHPVTESVPIRSEYKPLLEKATKTNGQPKQHKLKVTKLTKNINHVQDVINLSDIRSLVSILSVERATNYQTWIEVGLCLHNIDVSLLDNWISFSRKAPNFKEGDCEERWTTFEYKEDGLGVGSLHRWARVDNPKEYEQLQSQRLYDSINKSQSKTTQDVANVVFTRFRYQFICSSTKSNQNWYEFSNHRWTNDNDSASVSLRRKIGNEIVNEFLKVITYYNQIACEHEDEHKTADLSCAKTLAEVTYNLRDYTFKEKIMKECQVMFYDSTFTSKLDANPDLIGFDNGVYDLSTGTFRDGHPEDYVSLTTGYDYREFNEDDEEIVGLCQFMTDVFIDEETRDYVLTLLSSILEGRNPNEKFHIWTGSGGNGKSKLLELFESTIGMYGAKIPVTLLTQRTKTASSAANPEIARLKGIREVSAQEPDQDERFNINVLKEWTGGDKLTCRPLYGNPFDFKPQFKIIFCCNNMPKLPPYDDGVWRRISVVEFKSRFVDNPDPENKYEHKKDPYLSEKLHQWKEAFMFMLLTYYKKYKQYGLREPKSVREATRQYQMDNDLYSDFISSCLIKDENGMAKLEDTFRVFKVWWKETQSSTKPPSRKDMKGCLEHKLGKYQPNSRGGWRGWSLIESIDNSPNDDETDPNGITKNEQIITSGIIAKNDIPKNKPLL